LLEPYWAVKSLNAEFQSREAEKNDPGLTRMKLTFFGSDSQGLEVLPACGPSCSRH
jgi:hypothetical protein